MTVSAAAGAAARAALQLTPGAQSRALRGALVGRRSEIHVVGAASDWVERDRRYVPFALHARAAHRVLGAAWVEVGASAHVELAAAQARLCGYVG